MRTETTMIRRPKAWVTIGLALGHAAIIAALALLPHREPQNRPRSPNPSILECLQTGSPAPLR